MIKTNSGIAIGFVCLLMGFLYCPSAGAFSCSCLMEQKVGKGDFNKLGAVNVGCLPSPPQFWKTQTITTSGTAPLVSFSTTEVDTWDLTKATDTPGSGCNWGLADDFSFSGTATAGDTSATLYQDAINEAPYYLDDDTGDLDLCIGHIIGTGGLYIDCHVSGAFGWIADGFPTNVFLTETCTTNIWDKLWTNTAVGDTGFYRIHTEYSDPFTDADLQAEVILHIAAYPTNWATGTDGASALGYYGMGGHPATDRDCMLGSKMKYRLKVPDSEKGASYELTWQEVTTTVYFGGSTNVSIDPTKEETITGTGDPVNAAVGTEHEVPMPALTGDMLSVTIQELNPNLEKVTVPDLAGDGGDD